MDGTRSASSKKCSTNYFILQNSTACQHLGWICHVTHVVSAILSTWPIRFWELKFAKKHLRCWVLDLSSLELCLRYGSPRVSRNQVWYESTTFLWLTCPGSWNWCRKPCVLEMIQQQKRGTKGDEVNSSRGEVSFELDGFEDVFIVVFFYMSYDIRNRFGLV